LRRICDLGLRQISAARARFRTYGRAFGVFRRNPGWRPGV
jgi:hypothetical protein